MQARGIRVRDPNLDLLRAAAILLVVTYHVVQMSPVQMPRLMAWVTFGQYGVDLFFALSGWLIGSLYWNERARFGSIQLGRFWLRRWMRTIPPYLFALLLAWLAVFTQRTESFDWGYLLFLQNYYQRIPFFLVSWSLCIEEHFYLFLPLLLILPAPRGNRSVTLLFAALIVIAPVCRWLGSLNGISPNFGYEQTATHLRMEGLLLGFWTAYLPTSMPKTWAFLKGRASWLVVGSILELGIFVTLPEPWIYRVGLTLLSLGFVSLLVFLVGRTPGAITKSPLVNWIAVASYSVYLTHTLMIHVARRILESIPSLPSFLYFPVAFGFVVAGGGFFYLVAERTSIKFRDRYVSRRRSVLISSPLEAC